MKDGCDGSVSSESSPTFTSSTSPVDKHSCESPRTENERNTGGDIDGENVLRNWLLCLNNNPRLKHCGTLRLSDNTVRIAIHLSARKKNTVTAAHWKHSSRKLVVSESVDSYRDDLYGILRNRVAVVLPQVAKLTRYLGDL